MMITRNPLRPRTFVRASRMAPGAVAALLLTATAVQASPWQDVSTGLFNEAHAAFVHEKPSDPAEARRQRYGEAVALLNVQPRTQANIDQAATLFAEVAAAGQDDDLGIEARYMQGRVEQTQRATPNLAKADEIYSDLIARHPAHPVAQRAVVKLAIIRLYPQIDAAERRRRFDEFAARAATITDAGVKVQLHLLLGEFARRFDYGNEIEFFHMLAADRAGVVKRTLRVLLLARIGDLARLTHRKDVAIDYYTRFLEEFPRTDRRSTVERYLTELKSSS